MTLHRVAACSRRCSDAKPMVDFEIGVLAQSLRLLKPLEDASLSSFSTPLRDDSDCHPSSFR